jgi:hypothetical protein
MSFIASEKDMNVDLYEEKAGMIMNVCLRLLNWIDVYQFHFLSLC